MAPVLIWLFWNLAVCNSTPLQIAGSVWDDLPSRHQDLSAHTWQNPTGSSRVLIIRCETLYTRSLCHVDAKTLLPPLFQQHGRSVFRLSSVSMATQGVRGQCVCQQLMLFPAARQLRADAYQDRPIPGISISIHGDNNMHIRHSCMEFSIHFSWYFKTQTI